MMSAIIMSSGARRLSRRSGWKKLKLSIRPTCAPEQGVAQAAVRTGQAAGFGAHHARTRHRQDRRQLIGRTLMNQHAAPARSNSDLQLRMKVAACTLLLVREKIMNYSGHVSARLPGRDAFLIQPIDVPRSGLRPDHLLICDYDGNILEGPEGQRAPAEVSLHGEILRARPDVNSAAHFHHDLTNSFTLVEGVPLRVVKNHAIRWKAASPFTPIPRTSRTPSSDARSSRRSVHITRCKFAPMDK
jgi:hypothetical protein